MIRIGREIQCLRYAGFLIHNIYYSNHKSVLIFLGSPFYSRPCWLPLKTSVQPPLSLDLHRKDQNGTLCLFFENYYESILNVLEALNLIHPLRYLIAAPYCSDPLGECTFHFI